MSFGVCPNYCGSNEKQRKAGTDDKGVSMCRCRRLNVCSNRQTYVFTPDCQPATGAGHRAAGNFFEGELTSVMYSGILTF